MSQVYQVYQDYQVYQVYQNAKNLHLALQQASYAQLLQIIIGQQMRDVISKVPSDHLGRGTRSQINLVLITRTTVQFVLKPRTTVRFATDTKLQF